MKALLLDGSNANDSTGERVRLALTAQLHSQGWDVEHVLLREKNIGNCAGDFFCWVRTPGICNIDDDNRDIAAAIVASALMVYLTPVTFGGYSSALKRLVDHQIQNVTPFFAKIKGETHHQQRYKQYPDMLAVGWMEAPDTQAEAIFRHLVRRNAINFHAEANVSGVVLADKSGAEVVDSTQQWLNHLQNGQSSQHVELPAASVFDNGASKVRRALLLVGSPKTRKSTSNALGEYLFERLGEQSVQTETIHLYTVLRSPEKMQRLFEAVDAADLVTLAFPLYVDSLPAPVIEALERFAEHRQGLDRSRRQAFTAVANCGFPEAHHCSTALAICETFARQAGFEWAGGLALGGGQAINGAPLAQGGGKTKRMRQSLDLSAKALAQGKAIPEAAIDGLAKPIIPNWAYRLTGSLGWLVGAKHYGAIRSLKRKPYLTKAT